MFSHETAQKLLQKEQTPDWLELCLATIERELPEADRAPAYAILNFDEQGKTFVHYHLYDEEAAKRHQKAVERGLRQLADLSPEERKGIFSLLVPRAAAAVEAGWQLLGRLPYQTGWQRRAFRAPAREEEHFARRRQWITEIIPQLASYREKDLAWFAAWVPYIVAYNTQPFGVLFAAAIDEGGAEGQVVFDVLVASASGEHEIGRMGRHVTTGLLVAARPDGWNCMANLLLAAQREEGLRQVILETVDEAHPRAFLRMLRLVLEHNLLRFSATVRAADVWFDFGEMVEHTSDLQHALQTVLPFLEDQASCQEAIAHGNPQELYFALWSLAFINAEEAVTAAQPVLNDTLPERRLAAVHLLGQLGLPEARTALLPLLADPDLRVALHTFEGVTSSDTEQNPNNLFEELVPLLERLHGKEQTIKSGIWPWLEISVSPGMLLHIMLLCLGERDPRRLIVYLPLMSDYDRCNLVEKLAALPTWDEEVRDVLYKLVGDRKSWVRSRALALLGARPLDQQDVLALERLLVRKDVELRRGLIELLLKGKDEDVLRNSSRLLTMPHALQRLAGFDLLKGLVEGKRETQQVVELVHAYQKTHETLSAEEARLIETILVACSAGDTPTRENVLGLIAPGQRSPVVPPHQRAVTIDTPAARACLFALNTLIEEHRTTPVVIETWAGGSEEMLLGNIEGRFPHPDPALEITEDERRRLPLAEMWQAWERDRSVVLRDEDGLELWRAALLLKTTGVVTAVVVTQEEADVPHAYMPAMASLLTKGSARLIAERENDTTPVVEPEALRLRYYALIFALFDWLLRRQGMSAIALNFLLDTAEAALARVNLAELTDQGADQQRPAWFRHQVRAQLAHDGSLQLLRLSHAWHGSSWEPEQLKRYWQLLHWLDEPVPGLSRMRPELTMLMSAYQIGVANEADLFDHFGGPAAQDYYARSTDLQALSARTPHQFIEMYPVLRGIVDCLRARILEIELQRGDLSTAATELVFALSYSGGMKLFVRLVTLLKPSELARGYVYDNQSKGASFSHLLRVSSPDPEDSLEDFALLVKDARLDAEQLIAAAVYAPQWTKYVEYALGWPSLTDAVWWIYAHTRGSNWSVDEEIRKSWQVQVAERTIVSAPDLTDGAVDVAWFWKSYHGLGAERWERLYAAAKYASDGTGHGRARLYADAMNGKVSAEALCQRMFEKRQQDVVRALGLVPLPANEDERRAEITARYGALQEFRMTGRKFGAQRRASEEKAVRIGMENLARRAGFVDPLRLQWAVEAQTANDLRAGKLTIVADDVQLILELDADGAGSHLTVLGGKGKVLKALPARLKKLPEVVALLARKREIEQQVARMRVALEAAMCRGDHFTASELVALLAHPVLARLLQNLIFIQDSENHTAGYPLVCDNETGPQFCLRDYAGVTMSIDPAAVDLRLAHPYDLLKGQTWHEWQHDCFTAARVQPFKQIFRELYICTSSERPHGDEALSQRYSGHQVQPRQAYALLGQRGWIVGYEEGVRRTFHTEKLTAVVTFSRGVFTPTEVEGLTVDHVFFLRQGEFKPVPLTDVPPRVFSEAMRDLDLIVSVAHSGGVDPEATASTVEMRASLVSETCELLGLKNVTIRSSHVLIEGELGQYTVHLGSAVVHRQPGGAICIVPVHAQHRGRIFLPFADNDPRTAEVMTKVITLARDREIKDPSILEQIL